MIGSLQLQAIAARYGWQAPQDLPEVTAVSTDSRSIVAGSVYIALVGERFDGHDFCQQAVAAGAVVLVVSKPVDIDVPTILVEDTLKAYGLIALANREQFDGLVLALTGSAGKTTTKTMLATIMADEASTYATEANYNNEIGVPKSVLSIEEDHEFAVLELGAAKVGDIAYLCDFVKPHIALITNAAAAHIEGFGSLDGVAQGKGEIYQSLIEGTAVINADSPYFGYWRELARGNDILTFGISNGADVYATDIACDISGSEFDVVTKGQRYHCKLPVPGKHNVMNALAAIACAKAAGVDVAQSVLSLAAMHSVNSRMQLVEGVNSSRIIDDSYNANPTAFEKAIDTLAMGKGKRWLLMGDMKELGANETALHRHVGQYAKDKGIEQLLTVGELAKHASDVFHGRHFGSQEEMISEVSAQLTADDIVLIKGSRGARMENVVHALTQTMRRDTTC